MREPNVKRRQLLLGASAVAAGSVLMGPTRADALLPKAALANANASLTITGLEVFVVKVNVRGNWVFARLTTDKGLTGIGEASQGGTDDQITAALGDLFGLVKNRSPFDVEAYRRRGWAKATTGELYAGAYSALEQAQLDLIGKAIGAPVHQLLGGGAKRNALDVYANINRATNGDRSPEAFAANAQAAVADGFLALKAAVFDDFPPLTAPADQLEQFKELGIARAEAIRQAVGPDIGLGIDCHSHFDVPLAIEVAQRFEPLNLSTFEEPVQPRTKLAELEQIHDAVQQQVSGGESIFGVEGFTPICRNRALDIVMPDVKWCGGVKELGRIADLAKANGLLVSPHNPSGPVTTAVNAQVNARIPNFLDLEYAWGEVPWRADLITPAESFVDGKLPVSDRPGIGFELNDDALKAHA
ncbi:MAG: mandelate racemase/muconate lactonizing enzyme family protein [Acidimicrobiaceae bacterium]|nr:mandelate racemase/muconate lactonizing enzyme family protein [Acidimicrobiaceae bacterium]